MPNQYGQENIGAWKKDTDKSIWKYIFSVYKASQQTLTKQEKNNLLLGVMMLESNLESYYY